MFPKLRTSEHMVLLMLFEGVSVPSDYADVLPILHKKTFVNCKQDVIESEGKTSIVSKYEINKRGVAFVHQQRDPEDTIKFGNASLGFLTRLQKIVCDNQAAAKLTEAMFKSDKVKHKPKPQSKYTLGDKVSEEYKERLVELAVESVEAQPE